MVTENNTSSYAIQLLSGFIAGFLSTMIFHQLMLALLWGIGLAPSKPFSMEATHPFGLPAVVSLSFWGGIWGVLYVLIHGSFPVLGNYWVIAFLFGAIFPSLVALLVVYPLKGRPIGGGWNPKLLFVVFLINGAWGIGTGVFLKVLLSWFRRS